MLRPKFRTVTIAPACLAFACLALFIAIPLGCDSSNATGRADKSAPAYKASQADEAGQAAPAVPESARVTWHKNIPEAMALAKSEGKDLLMNFTGSDWCGWCKRLEREVFAKPEFAEVAAKKYIFVYVDFPRGDVHKAEVVDAELNNKLRAEHAVRGFPTILLATADGRAFGRTGYKAGGPAAYLKHLGELESTGAAIKKLFVPEIGQLDDATLHAGLAALGQAEMLTDPAFQPYVDLARTRDPDGKRGLKPLIDRLDELAVIRSTHERCMQSPRDWDELAVVLADSVHADGSVFVNAAYDCAQFFIKQERHAEARVLLERVAKDPSIAADEKARQTVRGLIEKCDQAAKGSEPGK